MTPERFLTWTLLCLIFAGLLGGGGYLVYNLWSSSQQAARERLEKKARAGTITEAESKELWSLLTAEEKRKINERREEAKITTAKIGVMALQTALEAYTTLHGELPADWAPLLQKGADGEPPVLRQADLVDPWGRPYRFDPAQLNPRTGRPKIWSEGPPGGVPISNW